MAGLSLNRIVTFITAMVALMTIGSVHAARTGYAGDMPYTAERPLRVVIDWDFAPFEYIDDDGEPAGYNIDVFNRVLKDLKIPYFFVMREREQAVEMFEKGEVDLIIEPLNNRSKHSAAVYYSRKTIYPYKIKIAYKRGTPPLRNIRQLGKGSLLAVKRYDYAAFRVLRHKDIDKKQLRINSPRTCLANIDNGLYQYFIYSEASIKNMLKKLNIDNIEVTDIDIPTGDMRFVAHDQQLINMLDDQFARFEQSGMKKQLVNKWFHPENETRNVPKIVLLVIVMVLVLLSAVIMANRLIANQIKYAVRRISEKNKLMEEALKMSGNSVVQLSITGERVDNLYGNHLPPEGMTAQQYYDLIHPDSQKAMADYTDRIIAGDRDTEKGQIYTWNAGTPDNPQWIQLYNQSIIEKWKDGKSLNIISTLTDITDERKKDKQHQILADKYASIFDLSVLGLLLYDSKGRLVNTNKRVRQILKFRSQEDDFYYKRNILNALLDGMHLSGEGIDNMVVCSKISVPERGVSEYAEIRVCPIRNAEGSLRHILVVLQLVTKEREMYLQRKVINDNIRRVNMETARYERALRYLLTESKTMNWRMSLATSHITYFRNQHTVDIEMSREEFIGRVVGDTNKKTAAEFLNTADGTVLPKTIVLPTVDLIHKDGKVRWYSINRLPDYDDNSNVIGLFGLIRDITEQEEAQERLRSEIIRANDSELQKNTFLANMSHEIRTPLNAIVGFCDLLPSMDGPEEKAELVRIIRKNCDLLIHLIDDILMISTMDADGPKIEPRKIDFALAFEDICTTLELHASESSARFIKDNPYLSFVTELDIECIQQIIINFTTNAVKFTACGHIKVGYRKEGEGIYIYCEDTGKGIPKEKCKDVFRRFVKLNDFVQGTGLGLNICKAIADVCGGDIGVESELDKGSTFWVWIPCVAESIVPREAGEC